MVPFTFRLVTWTEDDDDQSETVSDTHQLVFVLPSCLYNFQNHLPHCDGVVPSGAPGESLQVKPGGEDDPVYCLDQFVVLHAAGGPDCVHQVPLNVLRDVNQQDAAQPAGREDEDVSIPGELLPLVLVQHHHLTEEDAGVCVQFANVRVNGDLPRNFLKVRNYFGQRPLIKICNYPRDLIISCRQKVVLRSSNDSISMSTSTCITWIELANSLILIVFSSLQPLFLKGWLCNLNAQVTLDLK